MLRTTLKIVPIRKISSHFLHCPRKFSTVGTGTSTAIVVTAAGPDKVGIMSKITGVVTSHQGNVESGRMTRLGGEFCVMMLVQVPDGKLTPLDDALKRIEGLTISTHKTTPTPPKPEKTRQRLVKLTGADSIGILNSICQYFEQNSINVEDMATFSDQAPFSATPIFRMQATVSVPTRFNAAIFEREIQELSDRLGIDIWVESYKNTSEK